MAYGPEPARPAAPQSPAGSQPVEAHSPAEACERPPALPLPLPTEGTEKLEFN